MRTIDIKCLVNVVGVLVWLVIFAEATTVAGDIVKVKSDNIVELEPASQQQQQQLQQLARQNFLIGIAEVAAQHENHTTCGRELEVMLQAVARKEFWSLKVLDSFGDPPQSFGWGNHFWFSSQELCEDLNTPYLISFSQQHARPLLLNVTSPFPLRFTLVYMNFSTPYYIDLKLPFESLIYVGLCLPQSCSAEAFMHYTDVYFGKNVLELQRDFEIEMQAVGVRTPHFSWSFFTETSSVIFLSLLLWVLLVGLFAELIVKSKISLQNHQPQHTKPPTASKIYATMKSSQLEEVLVCFCITENCRRAFKPDGSKDNFLGVIAGLRTIVCMGVAIFHIYYFCLFAMRNTPLMFAKLESFVVQPIQQACYYVDVFFAISAFLLVYNFLSNETLMERIRRNNFAQNFKLFLKKILYRYIRLTPILGIIMIVSDIFYNLINTYSPFKIYEMSGYYCKNNWFYNLLYIQNFLDMDKICCSWSWYLACEMQYFVLFTVLLFLYAKHAKLAKVIYIALTLGFVVTAWWCYYLHNITFQIDVLRSTISSLYNKPWTRITPYFGGAALGWFLHHHRQHKVLLSAEHQQLQHRAGAVDRKCGTELPMVWHVAFWLFCAALFGSTNYMSYWRGTPTWVVATIMSFGKLLFAFCIGGVITLCALGRGGVFNKLLGARVFLFFNKFCYSIYLVEPIGIIGVFGLRNQATTFTVVGSCMDVLGILFLTISFSFLCVILVEMPMQRLANVLLKK